MLNFLGRNKKKTLCYIVQLDHCLINKLFDYKFSTVVLQKSFVMSLLTKEIFYYKVFLICKTYNIIVAYLMYTAITKLAFTFCFS